MLKSEKNKLFLALQTSELNINDFEIAEFDDALFLKSIPTKGIFSYKIHAASGTFNQFMSIANYFRPGYPEHVRINPQVVGYRYMEEVSNDVIKWIKTEVQMYLNENQEIDLWEEYLKGSSMLSHEQPDLSNTDEFTAVERQQIRSAINELRMHVPGQFKLDEHQLKGLNERLDYLGEAVDRLNKTDWKGIMISQFFSLITTLALNPAQAKILYDLFVKVLHVIPLLPSLPL